MIKNEIHALWNNKLLLAVLIAIMLIPAMYAGLFLSSMWDPYGDLEYLPVAVVNKDEPYKFNDKELTIGNDLADNLADNDAMAFNVVDEKTAQDGLENGTYYMVVTIPEDFSKNSSTLMDENPEKMVLDFQTNPGRNYISMKLSESAMKEIKANLTKEVTRTYAETVFNSLSDVIDGFASAVDGTDEMLDGEKKLVDGSNTITDNLVVLSDGAGTLKDGTVTLKDGTASLKDGTSTLKTGTASLKDGLKTYTDGVAEVDKGVSGDLTDGVGKINDSLPSVKKLSDGADSLSKSLPKYTAGVDSIAAGASTLAGNNTKLNAGMTELATSMGTAKQGSTDLAAGASKLNTGVTQLDAKVAGLIQSLGYTPEQAIQFYKASLPPAAASSPAVAKTETTKKTTTSTKVNDDAIAAVKNGVSDANSQISTAKETAESASGELTNASTNISSVQGTLNSLLASENLTDEQKASVSEAIASLEGANGSVTNASGSISSVIAALDGAKTSLGSVSDEELANAATETTVVETEENEILGAPTPEASSIPTTNVVAMLGGIYAGTQQLSSGSASVSAGATQLNAGLTAGASKITGDGTAANPGLVPSVKQYTAGVDALNKGAKTLSANSSALNSGSKQIATGTNTLYKSLSDGAPKLVKGVATLSAGTKKLVANNKTLNDGASKLNDGAIQLDEGAAKLSSGAGQLTDGAAKIQDGANKLADGSKTLGDGLDDLKEGTTTLHDALADGKEELEDNQASDATLDMFSQPVELNETKISEVENNGHAMAAYMFSVGLWVGCLAFCLMYPLAKYTGELTNGRAWWASKAVILYPLSILMVALLLTILHFALGFDPASMGETFIVALAAVACFMSIMYFFNLSLGKVGSFLMLLFMVLQLTGSAGTYPVEISGKLAQALNKWMPFTYSVNGFRAAIATGNDSIVKPVVVLFGLSIVFTLLTISVFRIRTVLTKQGKPFLYDWLEEKGLA